MTKTTVTLAHYHHQQRLETVEVPIEKARAELDARNAEANKGFRWTLCPTNFYDENGVGLTVEEGNEIRRACGVPTW